MHYDKPKSGNDEDTCIEEAIQGWECNKHSIHTTCKSPPDQNNSENRRDAS